MAVELDGARESKLAGAVCFDGGSAESQFLGALVACQKHF
jgi:hypothetical protein